MLVVDKEEGFENIVMGVSIRNEVINGSGEVLTVVSYCCCPPRTGCRRDAAERWSRNRIFH